MKKKFIYLGIALIVLAVIALFVYSNTSCRSSP